MASVNIATLRKEEFAHSYHWDVGFADYPGQFFPAVSASNPVASFINGELDFGPTVVRYPNKIDFPSISFQMLEVSDWKLVKYLKKWSEQIFNKRTLEVALIGTVGRKITIDLLGYDYETPVVKQNYLVVPDGEILVELGSEKGGLVNISATFIVVGEE